MSEEKMERVYLREHRNKVLCIIWENVNTEIVIVRFLTYSLMKVLIHFHPMFTCLDVSLLTMSRSRKYSHYTMVRVWALPLWLFI